MHVRAAANQPLASARNRSATTRWPPGNAFTEAAQCNVPLVCVPSHSVRLGHSAPCKLRPKASRYALTQAILPALRVIRGGPPYVGKGTTGTQAGDYLAGSNLSCRGPVCPVPSLSLRSRHHFLEWRPASAFFHAPLIGTGSGRAASILAGARAAAGGTSMRGPRSIS